MTEPANPLVELVETRRAERDRDQSAPGAGEALAPGSGFGRPRSGRGACASTADGALAGLRVAVTRSRDRAGALVSALASAGAEPVLVPLIDFELAPDQEALDAWLQRLAAGEFLWLVVSSITTVRALKQWCAAHGTTLGALVPDTTKIATIGPSSRKVLEAEGLRVHLAPVDVQSAAGLVGLWPAGDGTVLLPHSNLAESTLEDGLAAAGYTVDTVTAYVTVDYPASARNRLTAVLASSAEWATGNAAADDAPADPLDTVPEISPAEAAAELRAGTLGAVVVASPSAARRVAEAMAPLPPGCLLVAIGQPTRAESLRHGLPVAATAKHPTPAGIVDALIAARVRAAETSH